MGCQAELCCVVQVAVVVRLPVNEYDVTAAEGPCGLVHLHHEILYRLPSPAAVRRVFLPDAAGEEEQVLAVRAGAVVPQDLWEQGRGEYSGQNLLMMKVDQFLVSTPSSADH